MTEEQKTTIKTYANTLDSNVIDGDLLDLVVDLTGDRVLLYLNETVLDAKLERVVAQIVVSNYHSIKNREGGIETSVSRVEDNGQAVTYKENAVKYFTANDDSVFSGFTALLAPYRRMHVITTEL